MLVCRETTLLFEGSGNQLCPHILIDSPSPTLQTTPLFMTSLTSKILLQAKEHRGLTGASRMLPLGKYFALKTLYSKESLWCNRRQTYFARKELLKF